jgi:hypothetical protein
MANQMIALQTRNPQLPDPAKMTAQYASLMNMAQQNETAKRQAMQAQQTMDINAAEEARAARIAEPQFAKAQSEATAADIKTAMDFNNFVRVALSNSDSPDQVAMFAARIADQPQFKNPVFQGALSDAIASMPTDPVQFEAWKEKTALSTLEADKRYEQVFKTQTTGTEQREIAMPKYGRGAAVEVPGSRIQVPQGMQYIRDADDNIRVVPKEAGGGFDTPAPAVGTPAPSMGAPGRGNTADVVYGFGKFGSPDKPLSTMRIGDVQRFQRQLIDKTRGKIGAGPDKGTGAVGTYQIVYGTLKDYAPKVLGPNWREKTFTADVQEQIARAIYEDVKGGDLKKTWAGLPSNRPGQYANVPWEQVRDKIIRVESGGGPRRTPTSGASAPTASTGEPPIIIPGSGAKAKPSTEGERRFGTISRQMRTNLKGAVEILRTNPDAIRPTGVEYAASQIPFYGEEARLFAESEPRQQFVATILRFLDNITFVNTGAGTSKEQEANYRRSYIPTYQDTPASAYRKLVAMAEFAKNVKDAAGVMWTPELDADFNALTKAIEKLKPTGAAAPKAGRRTPVPRKASGGFTVVKVED